MANRRRSDERSGGRGHNSNSRCWDPRCIQGLPLHAYASMPLSRSSPSSSEPSAASWLGSSSSPLCTTSSSSRGSRSACKRAFTARSARTAFQKRQCPAALPRLTMVGVGACSDWPGCCGAAEMSWGEIRSPAGHSTRLIFAFRSIEVTITGFAIARAVVDSRRPQLCKAAP